MDDKFCPNCGKQCLQLNETTEPDESGEYKEIRTCRDCNLLVYIFCFMDATPFVQEQDSGRRCYCGRSLPADNEASLCETCLTHSKCRLTTSYHGNGIKSIG